MEMKGVFELGLSVKKRAIIRFCKIRSFFKVIILTSVETIKLPFIVPSPD